ncbi:MAG: hemagglutinin, partial [Pseudomonas sp.]
LGLTISGKLDNHAGGVIGAGGTLAGAAFEVDNRAGQINAQQSLLFTGTSLDNGGGQLSSAGALSLTLLGALSNANQAQLASGGPLLLKAASLDNRGGQLISRGLLSILSGTLNNSAKGTVASRDALTLSLSGALNNSANGLLHSQTGTLDLKAQSLNNDGGALYSQGDLNLSLDGALNNQNGQIHSQAGHLDLQKSTGVDNSGGVLSSAGGWLKLLSAGLFDNDGGITQAQALDIQAAQGLDNRAGHLSALAGDTRISTAIFNNQGGGLYAHNLLQLVAGDFNNQGAAQGQGGKVAAQSLDFGLSGALNNAYGILESDGSLALSASSLDNRNGALRALGTGGSTRLTSAGLLDNRNGVLETANAAFTLDVANLANTAGKILHTGAGNFDIATGHVTQAGGSLITQGGLTLNADSWSNSSVLQAGRLTLNIGSFTQTASGQLLASQSLTGTGGAWVNDGLLASDGSLSLTLSGGYGGNGRLTSLGELSLNAASIDLPSAARITGGGLTTVTSSGLLSNRGKLTAAADLTVNAGTLNNYGTLGSAEKLSLYAPTLLNENGLIFSGADMALRVNGFTNRYADLYSLGGLDIALDDQGNKAAALKNLSATLESARDMRVAVNSFENAKAVFDMESELVFGRIDMECRQHCRGRDWYKAGLVTIRETWASTISHDSKLGSVIAGGNLSIQGASTVQNRYSLLSAGGNMSIQGTDVQNIGAVSLAGQRYVENDPGRIPTATWNSLEWQAQDFNASYGTPQTFDQALYLELKNQFDPGLFPAVHAPLPVTQDGSQLIPAIIQAGGTVSINASNDISNITTRSNTPAANGTSRVADTSIGKSAQTVVVLNAQLPPDLQQQQVNPLSLPGFSLPQGQNGLFRLSGQTGQNAAASAAQGAVGDRTLGGRSIALGQREQRLGALETQGRSFTVATQGGLAASQIESSAWSLTNSSGSLLASGSGVAQDAGNLPAPVAPNGQALPEAVALPGSAQQIQRSAAQAADIGAVSGQRVSLGEGQSRPGVTTVALEAGAAMAGDRALPGDAPPLPRRPNMPA